MLRKISLLMLFTIVWSYQKFQMLIPNGDAVPNPCNGQSGIWGGVGHNVAPGGGPNNQFGLDFNSSGKVWTPEFCQKDSDQDGKSNGFELGDADCKWTPGGTPEGTATGHPGICEPMNSSKCQQVNKNITCSPNNHT
ncbi:temptin-like [Mytilus californianus]|uniref:temptin-like n=1 Tax=Mytilus californianus TaxID=6549 RepID=UPI0022484E26|nr:temptin-like [Mytilus californianus]